MAPSAEPKKKSPTWPDGPPTTPLPVLPVPLEAMWNPAPNRRLPADSHLHRHGCSARNITWQYLHSNGTLARPYADCPMAPVFLTQRKCRRGACVRDQMMQRYMWFDWDGLRDPFIISTVDDVPSPQLLAARSERTAGHSPSSLPQEENLGKGVVASLSGLLALLFLGVVIKRIYDKLKEEESNARRDVIEWARVEGAAVGSGNPGSDKSIVRR